MYRTFKEHLLPIKKDDPIKKDKQYEQANYDLWINIQNDSQSHRSSWKYRLKWQWMSIHPYLIGKS